MENTLVNIQQCFKCYGLITILRVFYRLPVVIIMPQKKRGYIKQNIQFPKNNERKILNQIVLKQVDEYNIQFCNLIRTVSTVYHSNITERVNRSYMN